MSNNEFVVTRDFGEQTSEQVNNSELVSNIATFGDQNVRTHVVDARSDATDPTVIVPRSFDSRLGPDGEDNEVQRDRAMAAATNSRIIGVDMPGIGLNEDAKSSFGQLNAAGVRGDISGLTVAQMEAAIAAGNLQDNDEIGFIGYSMAAWSVAESIKAMQSEELSKKLRIGGVALLEVVNDFNWSLYALQKQIVEETNEENVNRYLAYNDRFGLAVPRDRVPGNYTQKQKADKGTGAALSLALGAGMRNGFAASLVESYKQDGSDNTTGIATAPLVVARTGGSTVARPGQNRALLGLIRPSESVFEFGPDENGLEHRHPVWQSIPHAAAVAQRLNSRMV